MASSINGRCPFVVSPRRLIMGAPTTAPQQLIPVDLIDPAEDNFRGPVGDISELAELIKAQGLLQAIKVTPKPEARAYKTMLELTDEQGKKVYTQRTVAQKRGVGQAKVSNYTSIFKLADDVVALLDSGEINVTQAIQLARLAKHPDRVQAALSHYRRFGGDIELAVRRQQDELDREQARTKKLKELKATGVRLAPDDWVGAGAYRVGPGFSVPMEPEEHASELCHAATVNTIGEVIYLCMEPARHRASPEPSPEPAATGEGQEATPGRPDLAVVPAPPEKTPEEEAAEAARLAEEEARQ